MAEAALEFEPLPLLDFIPALSPRWSRPDHLERLASAFERSERGEVFVYADPPPRHGKTELLKHAIVRRLLADPTTRIAYGGYSARFAQKKSREIRALYRRAGGPLAKDAASVADWRTGIETGGLWATGVDGSWTGEGFDLIVVDDPVKGRATAESAVEREKLWEWAIGDLSTRREPGGSIIVVHTRWTPEDMGGRMLAQGILGRPVEYVHLPAIRADGTALWPQRYSIEELNRIRVGVTEYNWASQFMGQPYPKGGRLFHDVQYYDALPPDLRVVIGIDLAYSRKTHADYSVIVLLGVDDITGKIYVLRVIRAQEKAPEFAARIKAVQADYPGVTARWYYAGPEIGIVQFAATLGIDIEAVPAKSDKFVRAQPVAAAWNGTKADGEMAGAEPRIFVPRPQDGPEDWVHPFVNELVSFTGVNDLHDDQVDALAAAYDQSEVPGFVQAMGAWRRAAGRGPIEAAGTGWRR